MPAIGGIRVSARASSTMSTAALTRAAVLIVLFCALQGLTAQPAYAYQDVRLEDGQTYDLSSASRATWLRIDRGGAFAITGSSHRVLLDISVPEGQVATVVLDGAVIDPDGSAPGVAWANRSGITIGETGGEVRLLSRAGTTSRVNGYGARPAIRKDGTRTKLVFATTEPSMPGVLIATASRSSFRTSGIGAYTPNAFHNGGNTFGNVVFESGAVEAYGSHGNALTTGGPGIGADAGGNVDSIAITGGRVKAVAGDMSAAAIGTSSADVIYLIWPTLNDYTIFPRDVRNISITGGEVEALHATGANYGGAGIGGGYGCSANGITISGGTVHAEGSTGIGGGHDGDGLNIRITGGAVTARGIETGIGGGYSSGPINNVAAATFGNATVDISGGTVVAKADMVKADGVGIGSWKGGSNPSGSVAITGGTVTASGQGRGAGIGCGFYGSLGRVVISGGTVHAQGGDEGFGIGKMERHGDSSGNPIDAVVGSISISGGTVTAVGGASASKDIGAYSKVKLFKTPEKTPVYISGGNIKAEKGIFVQPKHSPSGPEVFAYTFDLDTYGYESDLSGHDMTSLSVEGYPAGYSYGTNGMHPFADSNAATMHVWIPSGAGVREARMSPGCEHMANRANQFKGFPTPTKTTLHPETHARLDANAGGVAEGHCFAWQGSSETLFQAVGERRGYKVVGYALQHDGATMLLDAQGRLQPGIPGYTDAAGRWIGGNRENYDGLRLYAQWAPLAYTAGFDANYPVTASTREAAGGSMADIACEFSAEQTLPPNAFALPGYGFMGWNTEADGSGTSYGEGARVIDLAEEDGARVVLFAQWTPKSYEIAFNPGEGLGGPATQVLAFDSPASLSSVEALGYSNPSSRFLGWSVGSLGHLFENSEVVQNVCMIGPDGDPQGRHLTAIWADVATVSISVTLDDAPWTDLEVTLVSDTYRVPCAYDGGAGSYLCAGVPNQEDYAIEIVADGEALDTEGIVLGSGETMRHIDYCTVKVSAEPHAQATVNLGTAPLVVLERRSVALATTVDAGYRFESYSAVGCQPLWQDGDPTISEQDAVITGATAIEAHPTPVRYAVVFDANGGEGAASPQDFVFDEPQDLFANAFTRTGYAFAGWTLSPAWEGRLYADGESVENLTDVSGSVVLYAQWSPNAYFIRYEGNGMPGAMMDQKCFYGNDSPLAPDSDVAFDHENFHLVEWNTSPDGTGTGYAPGQGVTNLTSVEGEVISLFAQWERDTYTVEFDANGGEGTMGARQMSRGLTESLDSVGFTRPLYRFSSWNTSPDGSGTRYEDCEPVRDLAASGGSATLFAQWELHSCSVAFDANGGHGTMDDQEFVGDQRGTLEPCAFEREGFSFRGWNTKPDGSGAAYADGEDVVNIAPLGTTLTLYAQWGSSPGPPPIDPDVPDNPDGPDDQEPGDVLPGTGDQALTPWLGLAALLAILSLAAAAAAVRRS